MEHSHPFRWMETLTVLNNYINSIYFTCLFQRLSRNGSVRPNCSGTSGDFGSKIENWFKLCNSPCLNNWSKGNARSASTSPPTQHTIVHLSTRQETCKHFLTVYVRKSCPIYFVFLYAFCFWNSLVFTLLFWAWYSRRMISLFILCPQKSV